jgi:hypothetical protein
VRIVGITVRDDIVGLCDLKGSYQYVFGFLWLRSCDNLKFIEKIWNKVINKYMA